MDEAEEWMKISEKLAEWIFFLSLILENFDDLQFHNAAIIQEIHAWISPSIYLPQ